MKILKFFVFAIAIVSLSACSGDDGPGSVELTNENLAGVYELVFLEGSEVETDGSTNVVVSTYEFTADTFDDAFFTFTENGMFMSSGNYRIATTTTVTGQQPEMGFEIETLDDDLTFSVNNQNRTITIDGETSDVTLFDGTNLYVKKTDIYSEDGNNYTFSSEARLVKQN